MSDPRRLTDPRPDADAGGSAHPLGRLADRLSQASAAPAQSALAQGAPAQGAPSARPDLEQLVSMLAQRNIQTEDRLNSALEGLARWVERADADPAVAPARPAQPGADVEARLRAFAEGMSSARASGAASAPLPPSARDSAPVPRWEKTAAPKPAASLRAALAQIAERQKALDADPEPAPMVAPLVAPLPAPAAAPPLRSPRPAAAAPAVADQNLVVGLREDIRTLGLALADVPTRAEIDGLVREIADLAGRLVQDRPARLDPASLKAIDALVVQVDRMRGDAASPQAIARFADDLVAVAARVDALGTSGSGAAEDLARRVEDIRAELDRFPRVDAVEALAGDIRRLIARLDARERAEAPTLAAVETLAGRMDALGGKIDGVAGGRRADADRVVQTLRAEFAASRAVVSDDLGRQFETLVSTLEAREAQGAPESLDALAQMVATLGDKIDGVAASARASGGDARRVVETLRGELQALAHAVLTHASPADGLDARIGALADTIDDLSSGRRADADRVVQTLSAEFAAARAGLSDDLVRQFEALIRTVEEREAHGASAGADGLADMIAAMSATMGDKLDDVAASTRARGGDAQRIVEAVRNEMQALAHAAVIPPSSVDELDARIGALADKIDQMAASGDARGVEAQRVLDVVRAELQTFSRADAMDDLVRQLEALTRSLETRGSPPAETLAAVDDLLGKVDGLGERIDDMAAATRARGVSFDRIEEAVRDIAEQLVTRGDGASGPDTDAVAAQIARLMDNLERTDGRIDDLHAGFAALAGRIEQSCARIGADVGAKVGADASAAVRATLGQQSGSAAEEGLGELAVALTDLRASAAQSDRRTADTLDAVRQTLERLVDRMETIGQDVAQPAAPAPQRYAPPAAPVADPTEAARAAARRAVAEMESGAEPQRFGRALTGATALTPVADFSAVDGLAPDHPLEPGSGPRLRADPPFDPAPESGAHKTASIIAAARRATLQPPADEAGTAAAPLSAPGAAEPSRVARVLAALKARRRPILLGIAATLIVLGVLRMASGMTGGEPQIAPAPAPVSDMRPAPRPDAAAADAPIVRSVPTHAEAPPPETAAEPPIAGAPLVPPRAGAADITDYAFAHAGAPLAQGFARATPADALVTGSLAPNDGALPDTIGGATLRMRAVTGDPSAQLEIADRLAEGRGVEPDLAAAARWLEKAAAQGLAPAQHRLGSAYEKGRGVARDIPAARRWYEQAAASGNVRAMHNLGVLHAEGGLGKPDFNAAAVWFRMAAERGLVDSQYNLGVLATRGLGAKRDLIDAYKWFALANAQGDADAGTKRDDVAKALGGRLAVAKEAVATFRPRAVDSAANDAPAPAGGWDLADMKSQRGAAPKLR